MCSGYKQSKKESLEKRKEGALVLNILLFYMAVKNRNKIHGNDDTIISLSFDPQFQQAVAVNSSQFIIGWYLLFQAVKSNQASA
jgi:hypothetical protein